VGMAKVKDKHFWSYLVYGTPKWGMKNIDNYFDSFDINKSIVGETSVWYMNYGERLARVLKEMFPKAKYIVSIRNPIDRFLSHYNFQKYDNKIETHTIGEVIDINKHGRLSIVKDYGGSYLDLGLYYKYISLWMSVVGSGNVLVVDYDRIKSEPLNVINEILPFLGVRKTNTIDKSRVNKTTKKDSFNEAQIELLKDYYKEDVYKLSQMLGVDYNKKWGI
jgi:hypothetical protein